MTSFRLRILAQTLPFLLIAPVALAQAPAKAPSRAQATAALDQPAKPGAAHYTRQQIDQLVAPIALYPDELLSQVLMAATYPQQIVEASQWLQDPSHRDLKGDALAQALEPLPWDPSVKALAAFPQIVEMMAEHIEWTEALGVAFATQQAEVMSRVQALRQLAMKSGKLKQVKHLQIRQEGPTIVITSAEPNRVYVPVYNPTVVYGQWQDREFPPVYLPPPRDFVAETIEPGFEVSSGFAVVAPLWGWSRPDWRSNRIIVDRTAYTRITRNVEMGPGDAWRHSGPVMLVAPGAVSRTTTVTTTNVPAGTVLPGRAAAVVTLPQRAAAQPNLIQTQSTTTQTTTQPGQTTTTTSQPGTATTGATRPGTTTTTTAQPGAPGTTASPTTTTPGTTTAPPITAQPSKTESGQTTAQPSTTRSTTAQPGQGSATTAQPSKSEPGKTPTTAAQPSTMQPGQAAGKAAQPSKEQATTTHPSASQAEKRPAAASETAKPSGQPSKSEAAKPETGKTEANAPASEHRPAESKSGQMPAHPSEAAKGESTKSPAASLPKEQTPGVTATKPPQPMTPREAEHGAAKPATGSSEQPARAPEHAGAKPPGGTASQPEHRPEQAGAKPSGPQMPGATGAAGHEPPHAAPPQGGQGSSAGPAAAPHQPAPNAQRPNPPGAHQPGQAPEPGKKEKEER
jgi:hypothetical protein